MKTFSRTSNCNQPSVRMPFVSTNTLSNCLRRISLEHMAIAIGIALRVHLWWTKHLGSMTFWLKAGLRKHTIPEILSQQLGFGQSAPVGFSLMSKLIGEASGWNNRAIMMPEVLAGIATLFVLSKCLDELKIKATKTWFMFYFALHPLLVFYGSDFKPYCFDGLISASLFLLFLRFRWKLNGVAFSVLCGIAPLFSTQSIFMIPVMLVILFIEQMVSCKTTSIGRRCVRSAQCLIMPATFFVIFGAIAIVHLFATMPNEQMNRYWSPFFCPVQSLWACMNWNFDRIARLFMSPACFYILPKTQYPIALKLAFGFPAAICVIGAKSFGFRRIRNPLYLAVCIWISVVFASGLRKWPIPTGSLSDARLLIFLIPPVLCTLALGFESIVCKIKFYGYCMMFVPMATTLFMTASNYSNWQNLNSDSERIARLIAANCDNGDHVLGDQFVSGILWATVPDFAEKIEPRYHLLRMSHDTRTRIMEIMQDICGTESAQVSKLHVFFHNDRRRIEVESLPYRYSCTNTSSVSYYVISLPVNSKHNL